MFAICRIQDVKLDKSYELQDISELVSYFNPSLIYPTDKISTFKIDTYVLDLLILFFNLIEFKESDINMITFI